ncbi:MAG: radical SAM protein [Candidatus Moranbacteria bacterium]|nr:radical SAM protein [Candidatus Moranbacteria bacterium]
MKAKETVSREEFSLWRMNLERKFVSHPLEIIQWETTRRCDMHCSHCGSPSERMVASQELSTGEIKGLFREIAQTIDLSGFRYLTLTGGEPFLRGDLLDVLGFVRDAFGWVSTIQTNGRYLASHREMIPELFSCGVRGIGLDLDGPEPLHDSLRGERGHFRSVVELARLLLGSLEEFFITVTTVVTPENIGSLGELWSVIRDLNPHRWRLLPIENVGRAEESRTLNGEELRALVEFVYERGVDTSGEENVVQIELGCIGWLGAGWEGLVRPYVWSCIAGKTCLGILYDGSFSGCAHIDRSFVQGNFRVDRVAEVWEERYGVFRNTPRPDTCRGCEEERLCTIPMHKLTSGGCMRECVFRTMNNT